MPLKILLIGNTGQVGFELNRTLLPLGEVLALDYPQFDLGDGPAIHDMVTSLKPHIIVNAAAYTNVDRAESEKDLALEINAAGPMTLAVEAKKINAALIHYSTDYVFDGQKGVPYVEDDPPNPLNIYGQSKLEGELGIQNIGGSYLIFRTSWVYSDRRPCFVQTILRLARERKSLSVVEDQHSNPTWARTLAEVTAQIIAQGGADPVGWVAERRGLYHLTDEGDCSRFEWAKAILELEPHRDEQIIQEILPVKSSDFPSPSTRPSDSRLSCEKIQNTFNLHLPHWRDTLKLMLSG